MRRQKWLIFGEWGIFYGEAGSPRRPLRRG